MHTRIRSLLSGFRVRPLRVRSTQPYLAPCDSTYAGFQGARSLFAMPDVMNPNIKYGYLAGPLYQDSTVKTEEAIKNLVRGTPSCRYDYDCEDRVNLMNQYFLD